MANMLMRRLKTAWNVFRDYDQLQQFAQRGVETSSRPDRPRLTHGAERSIVDSVYNRISLDVASADIRHVRLDEDGRYKEDIDSKLNYCLKTESSIDQTGRALIQDGVISMFNEGSVAFVPTVLDDSPAESSSCGICEIRTAKIIGWKPDAVRVDMYNNLTGHHQQMLLPKTMVAIVENPFYSVINEPNSTMQRLIRKLALLDVVDSQSGQANLDLIIQLPYTVKSPMRKQQAEERRADLERQLQESKYGVAYIDGTEHVTQLNRPVENNLLKQVEYLTDMLYSQLGITQEILAGTADDNAINNYYNRTVEPILLAITEEFERKFLTKTARTQGQAIRFYRDPFRMVPMTQLADLADKFIRNQIVASNEFRTSIGLKPSDDPKADELINPNVTQPAEREQAAEEEAVEELPLDEEGQNG